MSPSEAAKFHACLTMDNFVITFVAIEKSSRSLVKLFMNPLRELTVNPTKAAYFSDTAAGSTFLRAMGTDLPKIPEGYELVPHSSYFEKVTVVYRYPRRKSLEDPYSVEMTYKFWCDNPNKEYHAFDSAGHPIGRILDNAEQVIHE